MPQSFQALCAAVLDDDRTRVARLLESQPNLVRRGTVVEDHYELVRYAEYQPIWYPMVEAWRTGIVR